jgi:hypothetical protein
MMKGEVPSIRIIIYQYKNQVSFGRKGIGKGRKRTDLARSSLGQIAHDHDFLRIREGADGFADEQGELFPKLIFFRSTQILIVFSFENHESTVEENKKKKKTHVIIISCQGYRMILDGLSLD